MRLLLDENLPRQLRRSLADVYPGMSHVFEFDLLRKDDDVIWEFAKANGFVIVTKDVHFSERSQLYGAPPKVIWLRGGNCPKVELEVLLRSAEERLREFLDHPDKTCFSLWRLIS